MLMMMMMMMIDDDWWWLMICQLSLPSLWLRLIEYQPVWLRFIGVRSLVSGGR